MSPTCKRHTIVDAQDLEDLVVASVCERCGAWYVRPQTATAWGRLARVRGRAITLRLARREDADAVARILRHRGVGALVHLHADLVEAP